MGSCLEKNGNLHWPSAVLVLASWRALLMWRSTSVLPWCLQLTSRLQIAQWKLCVIGCCNEDPFFWPRHSGSFEPLDLPLAFLEIMCFHFPFFLWGKDDLLSVDLLLLFSDHLLSLCVWILSDKRLSSLDLRLLLFDDLLSADLWFHLSDDLTAVNL